MKLVDINSNSKVKINILPYPFIGNLKRLKILSPNSKFKKMLALNRKGTI